MILTCLSCLCSQMRTQHQKTEGSFSSCGLVQTLKTMALPVAFYLINHDGELPHKTHLNLVLGGVAVAWGVKSLDM